MAVSLKAINARINKIGNGERTFKEEMGIISRELLQYVVLDNTGDIDAVNRLLDVLNNRNRETAKKFFSKMLPYSWNNGEKRFGGKSKNKDMVNKRTDAIKNFLKDEANTIWTWNEQNSQPAERPARPKNYADKVVNLVEAALTDPKETERLDPKTLLKNAVKAMVHSNMKLADIFETFEAAIKEAEAEMKEVAELSTGEGQEGNQEQAVPRKKAA